MLRTRIPKAPVSLISSRAGNATYRALDLRGTRRSCDLENWEKPSRGKRAALVMMLGSPAVRDELVASSGPTRRVDPLPDAQASCHGSPGSKEGLHPTLHEQKGTSDEPETGSRLIACGALSAFLPATDDADISPRRNGLGASSRCETEPHQHRHRPRHNPTPDSPRGRPPLEAVKTETLYDPTRAEPQLEGIPRA